MASKREFQKKIKDVLWSNNMSASDFAKLVGVATRTVQHWLAGDRCASRKNQRVIKEALKKLGKVADMQSKCRTIDLRHAESRIKILARSDQIIDIRRDE